MSDIPIIKRQDLIKMGLKPKKETIYEKLCNLSEKIVPIPSIKRKEKDFQEAIDFCHLNITPKGAMTLSIISTLILLLFLILLTIIGIIPGKLTLLLVLAVLGLGYFLFRYPLYYVTQYKIKASSDMVLAVVYMTVSMKTKSNLENAVIFAASNLEGPLAIDLTELIWDVYIGKYYSMENAIDNFIKKWKRDNEEFTQSLNLIKTSLNENYKDKEQVLNEAVQSVLEGTKSRMKHYSQDLRSSLTILNALGILLPIIGLIFFPMITIFMPEVIKPLALAVFYDILLPVIVFLLMMSFLKRRPTSFHRPELLQENTGAKKLTKNKLISILIAGVLIGSGFFGISRTKELFSFSLILYSLVVLLGIVGSIVVFCFLTSLPKMQEKNDIIEMENELHLVLFQLGYQIRTGGSIENNLAKIRSKIKELKISKLFDSVINNVQMFGMTFEQALLDSTNGALYKYPSGLIKAIFKAISEISRSGSVVLSNSMISISNYLKNMRDVEEYLRDMLSEVTSNMRTQAILLAPIASGVVVALTSMMMFMLINLSQMVVDFQNQLGTSGPVGAIGGNIFNSLFNINSIIPPHLFQLIVGIYMVEIVGMLSIFLSLIEHGEEKIQRYYDLGITLLIAFIIYSVTVVMLYLILTSMVSMGVIG